MDRALVEERAGLAGLSMPIRLGGGDLRSPDAIRLTRDLPLTR